MQKEQAKRHLATTIQYTENTKARSQLWAVYLRLLLHYGYELQRRQVLCGTGEKEDGEGRVDEDKTKDERDENRDCHSSRPSIIY